VASIREGRMVAADSEGDQERLLSLIVERLAAGDATPEEQRFIARLMDPKARTTFRLNLEKRGTGGVAQVRENGARFGRLWSLWSGLDDKTQFTRLAAEQEGVTRQAANRWRRKFIEAEEAAREE